MSDKMRWRYGDTNPVVAAVDSTTVIEIGDLLWQDVDDAKPASLVASGPDEESLSPIGLQRKFADKFLGAAMQQSRNGDSSPIRVATTGVFDFECFLAMFELGDVVSPATNGANGGLLNQQVGRAASGKDAIGRVGRFQHGAATTSVLVDIQSRVMTNGVL